MRTALVLVPRCSALHPLAPDESPPHPLLLEESLLLPPQPLLLEESLVLLVSLPHPLEEALDESLVVLVSLPHPLDEALEESLVLLVSPPHPLEEALDEGLEESLEGSCAGSTSGAGVSTVPPQPLDSAVTPSPGADSTTSIQSGQRSR